MKALAWESTGKSTSSTSDPDDLFGSITEQCKTAVNVYVVITTATAVTFNNVGSICIWTSKTISNKERY